MSNVNWAWLAWARDLADFAVVALIIYWLLRSIRGTRALPMLIGIGVVVLSYWGTVFAGLDTLQWLLKNFLNLLPFIIIVIFQADIRRALVQVGTPFFSFLSSVESQKIFDELIRAVVGLAGQRIGALVILERNSPL